MKITFKNKLPIIINTIEEFELFLISSEIKTTKKLIRLPEQFKNKLEQFVSTTEEISLFQLKQYLKKLFGRVSVRTSQFWIIRGYSAEQAAYEISKIQKKCNDKLLLYKKQDPKKYEGTSCKSIKYWIKKGYTEEEAKKIISKSQSTFSLQKCIDKHGTIKGHKIWLERQKKWMFSLMNRSDDELNKMFKSRGKTKEQLIQKFGFEKAIQICKSKSNTYETQLKKYGKEIADEWLRKMQVRLKQVSLKKVSKISLELFEELMKMQFKNKEYVMYADNELCIKNPNKCFYLFDFAVNSPEVKKVIEFHGDFIHANPKKYSQDWFHPLKKLTAKQIWNQDFLKQKQVELHGFQYMVVWESDFKQNRNDTIAKCLEFLND
jgi:hypothetical protein